VGASTHPGGGIPAVLGGSLIATEKLLKRQVSQEPGELNSLLVANG
jgi:phytoene dehydrogenase-like protein